MWGASKVEDTYNLLGHALKKAIGVIAGQQGRGLTEVANDIGVDIVALSSLKAALDLNWDDPDQKNLALGIVLEALERCETFVQAQPGNTQHPQVSSALETARLIEAQNVEVDTHGEVKLLAGDKTTLSYTGQNFEKMVRTKNREHFCGSPLIICSLYLTKQPCALI